MADTIREQIIAAYMTRLAAWKVSNGFNYACGGTVQQAVQYFDEADLPGCVLWPGAETSEQKYGKNLIEMTFKVEPIVPVPDGTNPATIQEKLLGDAIKIMTDPSVAVTSLIDSIIYTGGGPGGINKPEETTTAIYAEFKIKYKAILGDPYSQ